uniref:LO5 n=1 Tax=Swordtail adomavirus 1 TaxID=2609876 RepID=A0A6F9F1Z4_9VIRU|nr:TPA_asm: LO5 [Swordtail adomavirus 1]
MQHLEVPSFSTHSHFAFVFQIKTEMNQGKQYQDYYMIRPGEVARDMYVVFNDNEGNSCAQVKFDVPFQLVQQISGKRNVGVACTQFTVPNAPRNITVEFDNNVLYYKEHKIVLRDGYYESLDQIEEEIQLALASSNSQIGTIFQLDHLGYVTLTTEAPLYIPIARGRAVILDALSEKLGFTSPQYEHVTLDGYTCLKINPGTKANKCGDMFGAVSECLLTCDQCIYTKETHRVLCVFSLAAYPSRSHLHLLPIAKHRPIHDTPYLHSLCFRLVDRYNRPLSFVSGVPSATIELQHLI